MSTFADSSAVVKLYVDEAGHREVRKPEVLLVSALTRVEVPSALWRKHREGELDAADAQVLVEAFEADLLGEPDGRPRLVAIALPTRLLAAAARLAGVHGLRAADAVQLASACAARDADPRCETFVCFDAGLRRAGAAERFALVPQRLPAV